MEIEKSKYLVEHFSNLLTDEEKMAIKHFHSVYKIENSTSDKSKLTKFYKKTGWLTSDQKILNLLNDGYEGLEQKIAERILKENPDKIYFNNCPKCNKLARTPKAKQCRFCGNDWHD